VSQTNLRAAAARAAAKVMNDEITRAQRWAEERLRERVLAIPPSKRYHLEVEGRTVEVIDAQAVADAVGATAATDNAGA
jgi:hypothetical protein